MLTLLKIRNFALIDDLSVEFGEGLNLLTGETGSGKSIIVDSLSALTGDRVYSDLIKEGEDSARIEGIFAAVLNSEMRNELEEGGVEVDEDDMVELIIRRELSVSGRNRVYINDRLVTQGFLKKIGPFLADIHGQGEQTTLFSPANHLEILDDFAGLGEERARVADTFGELSAVRSEMADLKQDEAQKLQLLDILHFQADEIGRANIGIGEDELLEEEKKRLNNVGKLAELSSEAYAQLYENDQSIVGSLETVTRRIKELAEYDSAFSEYVGELESTQAVLEDLSFSVRDFAGRLEFSPFRIEEIEDRLAEISRLKRKYGGSVETLLDHKSEAEKRLNSIEMAEERVRELNALAAKLETGYLADALDLHNKRVKSAALFEDQVKTGLKSVALDKARFIVDFNAPEDRESGNPVSEELMSSKGIDRIEFLFSANPGESPKPLARVASGGEASRLMLVIKTASKTADGGKTAVFDEIDAGIGGRVAEAVGLKLKDLSKNQQVLCVTHQPQIASLADHHFVVEKHTDGKKTEIGVLELDENEKILEIARMLAGETVSETAREHAKEMLRAAR